LISPLESRKQTKAETRPRRVERQHGRHVGALDDVSLHSDPIDQGRQPPQERRNLGSHELSRGRPALEDDVRRERSDARILRLESVQQSLDDLDRSPHHDGLIFQA
jgi:hypothetical protein